MSSAKTKIAAPRPVLASAAGTGQECTGQESRPVRGRTSAATPQENSREKAIENKANKRSREFYFQADISIQLMFSNLTHLFMPSKRKLNNEPSHLGSSSDDDGAQRRKKSRAEPPERVAKFRNRDSVARKRRFVDSRNNMHRKRTQSVLAAELKQPDQPRDKPKSSQRH